MADDKNQSRNQEPGRNQQPDQKNESPGTEQNTGSEMGQQQSQRSTSNWQSGTRGFGEGEQSERATSDAQQEEV